VVLVTQSLGWGGLERVVLDLARGLDRARWRPLVYSLSPQIPMAEAFEACGVPVKVVEQHGLDLGLPRRLARALRADRAGLVHAHNFGRFFYAGPAARLARAPALYTEHSNTRRDERALWLTQRRLSRWAGVVAAVSSQVRRGLVADQGLPAEKVWVVPNGIDPEPYAAAAVEREAVRAELGLPAEALVVGSVARLAPIKNQELLLAALALRPEAWLVLAGDGPRRSALEALAGELGVASRVRFLGLRRDVPRVLAACDLFSLSSHSEGLPIAVLEAMAAGLPVVATRVGGLPDAVTDGRTGRLTPPGDAAALAAAWGELLAPERRRALGQAGQAVLRERFSLAAMVAAYDGIYRQLLGA
jgi:glycosyltransferase involved in cell wall biosynthesis